MDRKFNYFYKITNLINGKYYYGIHSTDKLDDGYMGSGVKLKKDIKKFGVENFKKDILKFFDDRKKLEEYEREIVNENVVSDSQCYNLILGGDFSTVGMISVQDVNGDYVLIPLSEYDKTKYKRNMSGKTVVIDDNGNNIIVGVDSEERKKYKNCNSNKSIYVIDGIKKRLYVDSEEVLGGRAVSVHKGYALYKDENGKCYKLKKDSPLISEKGLIPFMLGRHLSDEAKEHQKETYKKTKHQQGEKNSHYGTVWMHNGTINKIVKRENIDNEISNGWEVGRYVVGEPIIEIDMEILQKMLSSKKTYQEIANYFNCSLSTIKRRILALKSNK